MPEPTQYTFNHKEIVEMMIKKIGLHEGKWVLVVNFAFGAANGGVTPNEALPTAFAAIQFFGLQKAQSDSPASLTVDAGEVNPAPGKAKSKAKAG
jgi:hypothetical protein